MYTELKALQSGMACYIARVWYQSNISVLSNAENCGGGSAVGEAFSCSQVSLRRLIGINLD